MADRPGLIHIALRARCPRCGGGPLFSGLLGLAAQCTVCQQDYRGFNVGDGAAAGVILIVNILVMPLALIVDFRFGPPWWVHMLLWLPVVIGLCLLLLRVSKALLVALEYRTSAGEGRS